jgi:hypothetical protein
MRLGHPAGQGEPSCKLGGNLLLSHLFFSDEKVREKEKLKWENGKYRINSLSCAKFSPLLLSIVPNKSSAFIGSGKIIGWFKSPFPVVLSYPSLVWASQKTQTSSRFLPLLLHQQLVRHQGDEFAIGGLVVLAVDVVAEEGVEVLNAWDALRPKRQLGC